MDWLLFARPQLGTWPASQGVCLTGIERAALWFAGWRSQSTEPHQPGLFIGSFKQTHLKAQLITQKKKKKKAELVF